MSGFSIKNVNIENAGNQDGESGIHLRNLTGTNRIENCLVEGFENTVNLENNTGVLTELKIIGSELNHNNPANTLAENGIQVLGFGDASLTLDIDDVIFEDLRGDGVIAAAGQSGQGATTSHINLTVHNCDFNGVHDPGANSEVRRGVRIGANNDGSCTFDISGVGGANNFLDQIGHGIIVKNDSNGLVQGRIDGNLFEQDNAAPAGTGSGKLIFADGNLGTVTGTTRVAITNNSKEDIDGFSLQTLSQDGAGVICEVEVGNNNNLDVAAGAVAEAWNGDVQDGSTLCVDLTTANGFGNSNYMAPGSGGFGGGDDIVFRNEASILLFEGLVGSTAGAADAHIEANHPAGVTSFVSLLSGGTVGGGSCASHVLPPTPLP